ncbi:MAG: ribbon-helix-helix protein, CopG family [Dehalococcoidia bacterium]|nr:ribbon-helix-helix protein, CopG family [Dehalococcoidia bacterium]
MTRYKDRGRPYIDEPLIDKDGSIVDVDEVVARVRKATGRPSMSGTTGISPQIGVRLPEVLNAALEARARAEGKSKSELVREAVEAYLD